MLKKNLLVLGVLLVIIAILFTIVLTKEEQKATGKVNIYVENELYKTLDMGQATTLTINGKEGKVNVLKLEKTGFYMEHASCKNQACIKQGKVTLDNYTSRPLGTKIICLPNQVLVEMVTESEEETVVLH